MEAFAIRLFIAIGLIWFTQTVLEAMKVKEPARQIIFVITVLACVLFIVGYLFI